MKSARSQAPLPLVPLLVLATLGCDSSGTVGYVPTDASLEAEIDAYVPPRFTNDGGQEAGGCFTCSEDLRNIFDCEGKLLQTCPDDQGCDPLQGACVPACDAARANQSSVGCDYYAVQPDGTQNSKLCFAVFVVNTWPTPVTLGAQYGSRGFDIEAVANIPVGSGESLTYQKLPGGVLPPGQMAILFVSGISQVCPGGYTPVSRPNVVGTDLGDAFHITSDRPVVAYDIYPYGGAFAQATSATLLLPTSAWGTNYVGVDPYERPDPSVSFGIDYPATLQIVAQADNTSVTVVPTHDVAEGFAVPGAAKNAPVTYLLDEGQVVQLASFESLNGSVVQADKPIGMWSTSALLNVDTTAFYGDTAHQQIPSVQTTGSEYVAVRYRNRIDGTEESPPWRILGLVDGTTLTYDPAPPAGAPTTLEAGEVVKFFAPGPFSVKSQDDAHPIYVSAHMTGCKTVGDDVNCPGDPEFVNVVPAKQLLPSYDFFTDPTYTDTNLVVMRPKADDGTFKDVTLDCTGPLTGWAPVGTGGKYEYTRVDLVRASTPVGTCDNGRHTMKSDSPFALTVWGWAGSVSYAYPAGVRARPINSVVIPPVAR